MSVYSSTYGINSHDKIRSITVASEFTLTKVCLHRTGNILIVESTEDPIGT